MHACIQVTDMKKVTCISGDLNLSVFQKHFKDNKICDNTNIEFKDCSNIDAYKI